ncbi:MAG: dTDP-glucose 4,6-dehydratase [Armatimonadetes bacterium]|nr:dTDP-glucose 4,6-dehydratase [Armatimonadota bacterium]
MQTLIVTGGAGFIGSNFVRYMLNKYPDYRIVVLDALTYAGNLDNLADVWKNPNFSFFKGDINDAALVDNLAQNADAIVNFAAESHNDRAILNPQAAVQSNFNGVWTLLEAARKFKHERFHHISTDEVYGTTDGIFREGDPLEPNQPYSAAKAGGELMVRAYHQTFGLPTIVTRGSNTFGPYHYPEKIIPLFITNLIDDQPVPVYGDGMQVRDWMYVLDHCRGIDIALHHGTPGEVYNVGGDNDRPNMEIVTLLLKFLNKPESLIRHVKDRPGHDRRYSLDVSKMGGLGYRPEKERFEERLKETVDWYVANEAWWRKIKEKQAEYQAFMNQWYAERK